MTEGTQATRPYLQRVVEEELEELTSSLPAAAIVGAKGVGKTATATRRATTVHALDDPAQRSVARADPARLLDSTTPILIDEWQYVPECWDLVRRAVDAGADRGRFLLTGSASPAEVESHSGAGRIVSTRMRPLALAERLVGQSSVSLRELLAGERPPVGGRTSLRIADYVREILHSGFPGMRHLSGRPLRAQLDGYLDRIIDRDFPELGHPIRNPAALRRWMTAYAAASSTTASLETIRDAATGGDGEKPAKTTTQPYRDVLERLWVLDPVPAWMPTEIASGVYRVPRSISSLTLHSRRDSLASMLTLSCPEERSAPRSLGTERCSARCSSLFAPCPCVCTPSRRRPRSFTCEPAEGSVRSTSSSSAKTDACLRSSSNWHATSATMTSAI